ncbi:MAG: hypothetical protein V3U80_06650 [Flavobacteriaceae bacterium]
MMPSPTFFIVGITTLIGLFYVKKIWQNKYRYFLFYLFFSFGIEILGYLFKHHYQIVDFPVYNIYAIVSFFFYQFFYQSLFKKTKNKKLVTIFIITYIVFSLFYILVLKKNIAQDFFVYNIIVVAVLNIATLIVFLSEIISESDGVLNLYKTFIFWISVGSLLFFIGVIPILISSYLLNFNGLFDHILTGLNVLRYGSFALAFIMFDRKYIYK